MILFRYIYYIFLCQVFVFRALFYFVHSLLVFLSKPGARLVVPLAIITGIYLAREPIDLLFGNQITNFWNGGLQALIGSELSQLLFPYRIIVTALIALFGVFIFLTLLASMLRPLIGTFAAPRKPLPPLSPMIAPNTEVKFVKARLVIAERSRNQFRGDLGELMARLPEQLQEISGRK